MIENFITAKEGQTNDKQTQHIYGILPWIIVNKAMIYCLSLKPSIRKLRRSCRDCQGSRLAQRKVKNNGTG